MKASRGISETYPFLGVCSSAKPTVTSFVVYVQVSWRVGKDHVWEENTVAAAQVHPQVNGLAINGDFGHHYII